jgi:hypothetical protein
MGGLKMSYSFDEQTIKINIDRSKCIDCKTKACARGCELYDRGILAIKDGMPTLKEGVDGKREGTECLACEEECRLRGFGVIKIDAPIPGLKEWYAKVSRG